jgi:hypothetical protein
MHALDWLPSTELSRVDPTDPSGSASGLIDLNKRLDAGASALKIVEGNLQTTLAALAPSKAQMDAVKIALLEAHAYAFPRRPTRASGS